MYSPGLIISYVPDLDKGEYNGYRPAGRRVLSGGIKDKVEVYNIPSTYYDICLD